MISIVIPFVHLDDELKKMTEECVQSYEDELRPGDEIILIDDTEMKLGNSGSWNAGIKKAKNDIVLLSDNDIIATKWREPMLKALDEFDIVFPVVYNASIGRSVRHLAGECWMFDKKHGLLDEYYGSYFEDTDFFMRVIEKGGKLGIAEGAHVVHRSQTTFKKAWSGEKLKAKFVRNKILYEARHGGTYPSLSN